jgi:carbamoyltransferase
MDFVGISCFYHDSSACLVRDGKVIAAAQEERFSRKKNTDEFPIHTLNFLSHKGNFLFKDVNGLAYFEKPYLKFSRVILQHLNSFPFSLQHFINSMPNWMGDRLALPPLIHEELSTNAPVFFLPHHLSHAASSFLPSPFEEAAILTCDGVGEWTTMSLGHGIGSKIKIGNEINYPDSLGLLYSTFTMFFGFHSYGSEGKTMAMAAFGEPRYQKEFEELIKVFDDGSFKLNLKYFSFINGKKMWNKRFELLFGRPHVKSEMFDQRFFDIAATLQIVLEKILILASRNLAKKTNSKNLCLAGGVALNCVANAKILEETSFQEIYIQPAAGDAGGAIGSALYMSNVINKEPRHYLSHSFLGPEYNETEILIALKLNKMTNYQKLDEELLLKKTAKAIYDNKIIGWFQGKMEFGPRALGGRSILANPCNPKMKDIINSRIKKRENFRPFAPMVLENLCSEFFELNIKSPFMLLAPKVKESKKNLIPSIVHADGTARVQTIEKNENRLVYKLIEEFEKLSTVPILLNTSFNGNGEPVVCSPKDAVDCFKRIDLDVLVIGDYWVEKNS